MPTACSFFGDQERVQKSFFLEAFGPFCQKSPEAGHFWEKSAGLSLRFLAGRADQVVVSDFLTN